MSTYSSKTGGTDDYWSRYWARRLSRRNVMRGTAMGAFGAGAALLVGCGDDSTSAGTPTPLSQVTQVAAQPTAAGVKAKVGGKILTTIASDPTSLDPHTGQGGGDHQHFWTIFDNLVNYDQKGNLDASISLASKWEIVNGTQINFTLRPGIKFHDGTPFNAAAVKYNIERIQDEKTQSSARAQILPVTKIETPNETTVNFILDKPNAALLTLLGDRGGAIISPASIDKFGKDTGRNPVGTGPFRLKEWQQGDHLTVVKSPDYWGKDANGTQYPYIDELRWNLIPDSTVALANLESGTIDIAGVAPADITRIKGTNKYGVATFVGTGWTGAYMNHALAPIDDLHFRRAMAFAIDKAAVVQAITLGQAPAGIGPLPPSSWGWNSKLKPIDFNLAEAKREMALSATPGGGKIETQLINTPTNVQLGELWKQMLKQINVDLVVTPGTTAQQTDRAFVKHDVHLNVSGFSLRTDPDGVLAETLGSKGFYNMGNKPNLELDGLIDKGRQTYDINQRKAFYDQVQQIAIDQVYDIYTYYTVVYSAGQSKVQNMDTIWGAEGKQRYKLLWLS